ncbi:hypothetical protein [Caenimonas koreensis]|uniref:hypothetical protein n=1 Tax=Caenimonas koreensis TaxID=367474 RepID=UPI00378311B7
MQSIAQGRETGSFTPFIGKPPAATTTSGIEDPPLSFHIHDPVAVHEDKPPAQPLPLTTPTVKHSGHNNIATLAHDLVFHVLEFLNDKQIASLIVTKGIATILAGHPPLKRMAALSHSAFSYLGIATMYTASRRAAPPGYDRAALALEQINAQRTFLTDNTGNWKAHMEDVIKAGSWGDLAALDKCNAWLAKFDAGQLDAIKSGDVLPVFRLNRAIPFQHERDVVELISKLTTPNPDLPKTQQFLEHLKGQVMEQNFLDFLAKSGISRAGPPHERQALTCSTTEQNAANCYESSRKEFPHDLRAIPTPAARPRPAVGPV